MRVRPSNWTTTLQRLGFRRVTGVRRNPSKRRLRVEELEIRRLLTVETTLNPAVDDPGQIADIPADARFVITDAAIQQIFTVDTVNDPDHGLEAVLKLAPTAPASLQTLYEFDVALTSEGTSLATYHVEVVVPGAQMVSDLKNEHSQEAQSILVAASSQDTGMSLATDGSLQTTTSEEWVPSTDDIASGAPWPVIAQPVTDATTSDTLDVVTSAANDVAAGNATTQDKLNLYAGISNVADTLAASNSKDSAQQDAHQLGATLYALADQIQADMAGSDQALAASAKAAYDAALAQSDVYFQEWTGKGINSQVYQQSTAQQLSYSQFYESGQTQIIDQFAVDLDRPALVTVSVPQNYFTAGASAFSTYATVNGTTDGVNQIDLPNGSTVYQNNWSMVVSGTPGSQSDGLVRFNLQALGVTSQQVDSATLQLFASGISSSPTISVYPVPNTTWNQYTISGATADSTLSATGSPVVSQIESSTGTKWVDVTEAVREAMRVGDTDFSGQLDAGSSHADFTAFEEEVLNLSAYNAQYGGYATIAKDATYRGDANFDGSVNRADIGPFLALHGLIQGDTNFDGVLNGLDVANVASHWLATNTTYENGDANFDGNVTGLDVAWNASHWLQTGSGVAAIPKLTLRISTSSNGSTMFSTDDDGNASHRPALSINQTPDLVMKGFSGDGTNLNVSYVITTDKLTGYQTIPSFNIGIYRSADGSANGQTLMQTYTVSDSSNLTPGPHTISIPAGTAFNIGSDYRNDYYLRAVLDSGNSLTEADETNNAQVFQGGVFQGADGTIQVHGTDTDDAIALTSSSISIGTVSYAVNLAASGTVFVRAHGGNDNVTTASGVQKAIFAYGGPGDDSLEGGPASDVLEGDAGNDTLIGHAGDDFYSFGNGGQLGTDTIVEQGGGGTDSLVFSSWAYGGPGVNVDLSSIDPSMLVANSGGTTLYLNMSGSPELENVYGTVNNDVFTSNSRDNSFTGSMGDDIYAFSGIGAQGNDSIYDTSGANTLDLSALDWGVGAYVDLTTNSSQQIMHATDGKTLTLSNVLNTIANVVGTQYDDTLTGNTLANTLNGQDGDDTLSGGGGNDTLSGGVGDDMILVQGTSGNDAFVVTTTSISNGTSLNDSLANVEAVYTDGQAGTDSLVFQGTPQTDRFFVNGSNVSWHAGASTLDVGIANITSMTINGNDGDDTLDATLADGIDLLTLSGGRGNDEIYGGQAADTLDGGDGNDLIIGNGGGDRFYPGAGSDSVFEDSTADAIYMAAGDSALDDRFSNSAGPVHVIDPNGIQNSPPRINFVGDQSATARQTLSFQVTATDTDLGQSLTYALQGPAPDGATITPSGYFTWTPTEQQAGLNYSIDIIAKDNGSVPLQDTSAFNVSVRTSFTPPELSAYGMTTVISLGWNSIPNAVDYVIQRRPHGTLSWQTIATVSQSEFIDNTFIDNTFSSPGATYDYQAAADFPDGRSLFSPTTTATALLSSPYNFVPTEQGSNVVLTWNYSGKVPSSFALERLIEGETGWSTIQTLNGSQTTYTDTTTAYGKTYWYQIAALFPDSQVPSYQQPTCVVMNVAAVPVIHAVYPYPLHNIWATPTSIQSIGSNEYKVTFGDGLLLNRGGTDLEFWNSPGTNLYSISLGGSGPTERVDGGYASVDLSDLGAAAGAAVRDLYISVLSGSGLPLGIGATDGDASALEAITWNVSGITNSEAETVGAVIGVGSTLRARIDILGVSSYPYPAGTWKFDYPSSVKVFYGSQPIASGQLYSTAAIPPDSQLLIQGVTASATPGDIAITATFFPSLKGNPSSTDTIRLTVGVLDLVDDANNDGTIDAQDESVKDVVGDDSKPGKVIVVDDSDTDGDSVPDYADGYSLDPNIPDEAQADGLKFTPLELNVASLPSNARLQISYNASDPLGVQSTAYDPFGLPLAGSIRVWTKDGDESRDGKAISQGGNYVSPGLYSLGDLGLQSGTSSITLYVEAVTRSASVGDLPITLTYTNPSSGAVIVNEARLTAVQVAFEANDGSGNWSPVDDLLTTDFSSSDANALPEAAAQYRVTVYDPRTTGPVNQFTINGQTLNMTSGGGVVHHSETFYAITPDSAQPYGNPKAITIDGNEVDWQYNPKGKARAIFFPELHEWDQQLADLITTAITEMQTEGWTPVKGGYSSKDAGAFGKEVEKRVTAQLANQDGWLTNVYVNSQNRIVSIGELPPGGVTGTTQIDVLRVKSGYNPAQGDILDRSKLVDLYDIKTSLSGGLDADQKLRLKFVINGAAPDPRDIKVALAPKRYVNGQFIDNPFYRTGFKVLGMLGIVASSYQSAHAMWSFDANDPDFQELVRKTENLRRGKYDTLQTRPEAVYLFINGPLKTYLSKFVDDPTALNLTVKLVEAKFLND